MPYKENKKWRGVVKLYGQRTTRSFLTKKEAIEWERQETKRRKRILKIRQDGLDLLSFSVKYLEYAERFSKKVFKEKRSVVKRFLRYMGPERLVGGITEEEVEGYLRDQKEARSANASNKDRKNLLSMWNKGIKTWGVKGNPFAGTQKFPHDRKPQYTPPVDDVLKVYMAATRKERVLLDVILETAMRKSSVLSLLWHEDINFEKRKIRVKTHKTKDGSLKAYWLDMSDKLYESLMWLWENRTIQESPYVFVNDYEYPNGKINPYFGQPFIVRRRFMPGLCERADVKPFGWHALRRFVASVYADTHKISMKKIQFILGHNSLRTTELYVQSIDKDMKNVMNLPKLILDNPGEIDDSGEKRTH